MRVRTERNTARRPRSAGVALLLLLLGVYALTMSGHTYSSDEETMLAAGESLGLRGTFAIPRSELFLMNLNRGVDGQRYSRYGPGMSVALVPAVWIGQAVGLAAPRYTGYIVRVVAALLPALVTALTALLLWDWARRLGYADRVAAGVGLLYGLTSFAWPFGRTLFAEPLATFFLTLCAYGLFRIERRWWAVAGLAAACALAVKVQVALAFGPIAVYVLIVALRRGDVHHRAHRGRGDSEKVRSSRGNAFSQMRGISLPPSEPEASNAPASASERPPGERSERSPQASASERRLRQAQPTGGVAVVIGRLGFGLLGAALPLGLFLLYNRLVFGGWLTTGYGDLSGGGGEALARGNWRDGLYGLTGSTGKGLFIYAPTVLLGLIGGWLGRRRLWREALLALLMLLSHLWFYSQVEYWHGDGSWGPRYLVFILPFLYLPAAGVLERVTGRSLRRPYTWAIGFLALLGLLVQVPPLLLNFNVYNDPAISRPGARYFEPAASPLLGHVRIWGGRMGEWWQRTVGAAPGTALLVQDFSYVEGDRARGELLPRWTYADATIQLYPFAADAPLEGRMLVRDDRPYPLPRAQFGLLLDGEPLAVERTDRDGNQIAWELRFTIPAAALRRGAALTLRSDTWNPNRDTQDNPRDEDLGVRLDVLELEQGGQTLRLAESLPVPPPQLTRRGLWRWTQDAPNHHLADIWLWYLSVSRMPWPGAALLLALIALPAVLAVVSGWRGMPGRASFTTEGAENTENVRG